MQEKIDTEAKGCGCGCGGVAAAPQDLPDWAAASENTLVCHCSGVSKATIRQVIEMGAYTLPLVKTMTGVARGKDCETLHPLGRSCEPDIQELIRLYHQGAPDFINRGGCCG